MRNLLYTLINKLGYRIVNKNKERAQLMLPLKKYGIKKNFNILFQSKYYIQNLENKFKDLTIVNHKEGFLVGFLDLNIYVESEEEFHILNEIFVRNDYDFITGSKSILIDIGANIGITSLFFSRLDFVDRIYAFEPVKDTFELAQYNFSLNDKIQKIATIKNIGLGSNSRKELFLFDKNCKGNTGLRGKSSPSYRNNISAKEREVQIESATFEIGSIIAENSNRKVIVKMDCEGGEYEILEDLFQSGMIDKIDVLLLEWHDKGSKVIEDMLIHSGFDYFSRHYDALTGMIYAFKK
ncbi:FkbM family methyltransferase [Mariniflexile litorale]|uniref:FkbM family methyltransferase n=1 Tax=Mariniflexile litorale TaxID=3045158 RepID=A0AAU7EAZ8_9FLAO|nr:FkbM family methyltransferase [Mariniflexile sp. KMM 9835]MDQ8212219.1 FkbM family methyltransferase [Mariniflexile sp. KMM 9835]